MSQASARPSLAFRPSARLRPSFVALVGLSAIGGCSSGSAPSTPTEAPLSLSVLSGDAQEGTVTFPLGLPLQLVATQGGQPKAGVGVTWNLLGQGYFEEAPGWEGRTFSTVTDANGVSAATVVLGGQSGEFRVLAATIDAPHAQVVFGGTAKAGRRANVNDFLDTEARDPGSTRRMSPAQVSVLSRGWVHWQFANGPHWLVPSGGGTQAKMQQAGSGEYSEFFVTPGTYGYRCLIHPAEGGAVLVEGDR